MLHRDIPLVASHAAMQHVDAQRDALLRASHSTDSPWRRTFRALAALAAHHVKDTGLAPGFWHLDGPDGKAGASAAFVEARMVVLSQAARLWWRLLIKYDGYPYKLLRLVDAQVRRSSGRASLQTCSTCQNVAWQATCSAPGPHKVM